MNAIKSKVDHDIELGRDLDESFAQTVQQDIRRQSTNLILDAIDDDAENILARCRLAYRRELARCLAEHYAKLAAE
jgi:hypothetical protein